MSSQGFSNELERALARPDSNRLHEVVSVYHAWSTRSNPRDDDWREELDVWFADPAEDWDRSLALVVLAMAKFDEPSFLGVVAAGLLEEILTHRPRPSEKFLERILQEARKTPRFRWLLSGVWRMSMDDDQAKAVAMVVGQVDINRDPVPPVPWA